MKPMDYLQCQINKVELKEFPLVEVVIFFILGTIVIFRKQWSSNDTYRDKVEARKNKGKTIVSTFRDISNEQVPKLKDAVEYVVDTVSETKRNLKHTIVNKLHQFTNSSPTSSSKQDIPLYKRFQFLKDDQKHAFLRMSDDTMFKLLSYLSRSELLALSETCSNLWIYLHSDLLWQHMWFRDYGHMWRHPRIAELRRLRCLSWDPSISSDPTSLSAASGPRSSAPSSGQPKQGWKYFYLEFQYAWMDWLLAGFTSPDKCFVGVYGRVLEITSFLNEHPGSPESLLDNAGCDATEMFNEIGHSTFARSVLPKLVYWDPNMQHSSSDYRSCQDVKNFSPMGGPYLQALNENYLSSNEPPPPEWTLGRDRPTFSSTSGSSVIISQTSTRSDTTADTSLNSSTSSVEDTNSRRAVSKVHRVKYGSKYAKRLHGTRRALSGSEQTRLHLTRAAVPLVNGVSGYQNCTISANHSDTSTYNTLFPSLTSTSTEEMEHCGQLRFVLDPVQRQWIGWWTCCGKGLECFAQPPPPTVTSTL